MQYQGIEISVSNGKPLPLGAHFRDGGVNFAIYSSVASQVILCLFEADLQVCSFKIDLDLHKNRTGNIWHIFLKGMFQEIIYGYKINGTLAPILDKQEVSKVLLDPYSRLLLGREEWGSPSCEYRSYISKNMDEFDWEGDHPLERSLNDTIIYELHVRGFTQHNTSGVTHPGTYQGIIEKIPYLKELGITAVELLPIHEFDEAEMFFSDPKTGVKLKNLWGYNTVGFFAPKSAYAASARQRNAIIEFKEMVKTLHQAGIEVILDVVFNHTVEGTELGKTYSFRGIDNATYYILDKDFKYKNFTGCGNTVNCNHPVVAQMIIDSLRYWVLEMHVDGFRFDLASVFFRDQDGSAMVKSVISDYIQRDPVLAKTKLIAEAWDASGLYHVGAFPDRWAEWNGSYRDCIRRFITGDKNMIPELATRITGSADLYQHSEKKPFSSINYVTCHDGFTLKDLVSYNKKHNEANCEENRDGTDANWSWNCGEEGETENPKIILLRKQQMKNCITLLMISQGVPMMLAGDEMARSQNGNNNTYCQDNELGWINWSFLEKNQEIFRFFKEMILFRKKQSMLHRDSFFTGKIDPEIQMPDISWHGRRLGQPDFSHESKLIAFIISANIHDSESCDIYVACNSTPQWRAFVIPSLQSGKEWYLKVDTYAVYPNDIYLDPDKGPMLASKYYILGPHSMIVLVSD